MTHSLSHPYLLELRDRSCRCCCFFRRRIVCSQLQQLLLQQHGAHGCEYEVVGLVRVRGEGGDLLQRRAHHVNDVAEARGQEGAGTCSSGGGGAPAVDAVMVVMSEAVSIHCQRCGQWAVWVRHSGRPVAHSVEPTLKRSK